MDGRVGWRKSDGWQGWLAGLAGERVMDDRVGWRNRVMDDRVGWRKSD